MVAPDLQTGHSTPPDPDATRPWRLFASKTPVYYSLTCARQRSNDGRRSDNCRRWRVTSCV